MLFFVNKIFPEIYSDVSSINSTFSINQIADSFLHACYSSHPNQAPNIWRPAKAISDSQFKYCILIWMFHGRILNNKKNRLNEIARRSMYNDQTSYSPDFKIMHTSKD